MNHVPVQKIGLVTIGGAKRVSFRIFTCPVFYGIINFFGVIFLSSLLILGPNNFEIFNIFSTLFFGKFITITLCWSFSFQILNEIRHLAWDLGYGFDLKVSKITGVITIIGSFVLAILVYIIGKNLV